MKLMKLYNEFQISKDEDWGTKPIFMPYGDWPWDDKISQHFDEAGGKKMLAEFKKRMSEEEGAGIPIYQGHPDSDKEEVAAKYPDKAALGWITDIKLVEGGVEFYVEWERFPGKGFKWFSPYWTGDFDKNTLTLNVTWVISIGLINRPNIKDFRLPNEEQSASQNNKGENMDKMKEICKLLGLAEDASWDAIWDAMRKAQDQANMVKAVKAALIEIKGGDIADADLENECKKLANEFKAAKDAKVALENEQQNGKVALENAKKEAADNKTALENEQAAHAETKKKLENVEQELAKFKGLKTESVTRALENAENVSKSEQRVALVNELMKSNGLNWDGAWALAQKQKPELFA